MMGQSNKSEGSWTEPITDKKFLYIPGGTFVMGSPTKEEGAASVRRDTTPCRSRYVLASRDGSNTGTVEGGYGPKPLRF